MSSQPTIPAKQYAALYVAAGWLRSELINIQGGEIDKARIERLIATTGTGKIEEVCGLPKDSMFLDFHQYISDREKHLIGATGADIDEKEELTNRHSQRR